LSALTEAHFPTSTTSGNSSGPPRGERLAAASVCTHRNFPVTRNSPEGGRPAARIAELAKRLFDIAFSALALILLFPVMCIVAALVKYSSPGPIFFRQTRIGRGGRPFSIYKFRSMYTDAAAYAVTPADDEQDPRVTPIGCFLRKSALDELPQFFCVLVGDMSVVGPRPEMPFLVEGYTERQRRRLALRPGVTGLWQISDSRKSPIHENLQYDRYYCLYRSFGLDLLIIAKTAMLSLEGAVAMLRSRRSRTAIGTARHSVESGLMKQA
jgi:lipopolysaccharide/colanic/teichoic acid biosynthesis glycosyltransferase